MSDKNSLTRTVNGPPAVKDDDLTNTPTFKKIEAEPRENAVIAVAEYARQAPAVMRSKSEPTVAKSKVYQDMKQLAAKGIKDDDTANQQVVKITINLGADGSNDPPFVIEAKVNTPSPGDEDEPLPL
jgi:hypothetical protein